MQSRILEVPLNKLVPSEANARRTHRAAGVEELAASIAALGGRLIQSLAVQPVLGRDGEETGSYRVSGGGRRLAALKLLAKRKVIGKAAPIPCVVAEGDEVEVSLTENVMREPLHPADQFEAFQRLSGKGEGPETIAARYGVTAHVVRQRLRLASVSPRLIERYREGGLTLDQLMAYSVSEDHGRQEQLFEQVRADAQPYLIRRLLTEGRVPAQDRRAVFVGAEAFCEAGGVVIRDLFTEDGGGWFDDPVLLDRLALEKLATLVSGVQGAEGWKWAGACLDQPAVAGLRRIYPSRQALPPEDQVRLDALTEQYDVLSAEVEEAGDEDEAAMERLASLSAEIDSLTARTYAFDPEDVARSGVFVVLERVGISVNRRIPKSAEV